VVALGVVELQGPGERGGDLVGRVLRTALLEADDVVDGEAGEGGELLAAQADRAALSADGQPGVGRGQAGAPGLQQPAELGVLCRHVLILSSPGRRCLVLAVLLPRRATRPSAAARRLGS
jgi:hypothetical protein